MSPSNNIVLKYLVIKKKKILIAFQSEQETRVSHESDVACLGRQMLCNASKYMGT